MLWLYNIYVFGCQTDKPTDKRYKEYMLINQISPHKEESTVLFIAAEIFTLLYIYL